MGSLTPVEMLTKIVYDELVETLGGAGYDPRFQLGTGQFVIMLAGLQGSGKTTTAAKLAARFKSEGNRPLLVAADLSRPAAVDQLKVLGKQVHTEVFSAERMRPRGAGQGGRGVRAQGGADAGARRHRRAPGIDEALMDELTRVKAAIEPKEILLVLDALTGQDALETAKRFDERLDLTGLVLTKLDGDARGGAALSMRAATGKPIRLVGMGEKVDALEYFYPDRVAGRILGRGDMLSLIEKASQAFDEDEAQRAGKEAAQPEELRPRRLHDRHAPGQEDGQHAPAAELHPRDEDHRGADGAGAAGDEEVRGHHLLDDGERAPRPDAAQRHPPHPHRQRQRHQRAGDQPLHQQFSEMQKMTQSLLKRGGLS